MKASILTTYFKRLLLLAFFTISGVSQSFAQFAVSVNHTAAVLSSTLAGSGITIINPTLTCPTVANGTFTSTGTLLAMSNGIVLTNGHAAACVGPYGAPPGTASFNDGAAGDPAMAPFLPAGTNTYDACILEFDMVAAGDSIGFNYQFGSQEYYHSTCGTYTDVFAFFISGPGITGTPNIALVPGTNVPVEVNSVNSGVPGGPGGVYGGDNIANCNAVGAGSPFPAYFISNVGGTQLSYVGYTTKFRAVHAVTPCDTYHLKLSIVDAGNADYDSGVFLEAASLTPPTIATPSVMCVGGTQTLTPPTTGGTWTSASTAIATVGSTTGVVTGISGGTATISYFIGPTCAITTVVTVTALAPIAGTLSLCLTATTGVTTTLTDAATGGTWSSSNTAVATIGSGTGLVHGFTIGTTTVSYTTAAGCSATAILTISAAPAITGTTSLCIGGSITLSDPAAGGTWTSSSTAIAAVTGSGLVTGIATGTAIITYTLSTGCYATIPIPVNTFYTTTLNIAICTGSSYTFAGAVYTVTGTYSHTFTTTTCDSIVTLNLTVNPPSSIVVYDSICSGTTYTFGGIVYSATGIYTYNTTNVYGCDSTVTLHLFVKPLPAAPGVSSPVVYCQNQVAVPLTATGAPLTWYTSPGAAGTPVAPTPATTVAGSTWYYVNQSLNGCQGPLDSIQVVVNPLPVAAITATKITLCQGDTATLSATAVPSGIYSWYAPGTTIVGGNPGSQTVVMQFTTLGNHLIFLTVSENGQCSASDSIVINAVPAPVVSFYVKPNVCFGDTVTVAVSGSTAGVTKCMWNFEDANIITFTDAVSGGPYGVTWSTTGIHYIQMNAEIGECVSQEVTDTVDVHPLPDAAFTILTTGDICTGDSVLLSATDADANYSYQWSPVHYFNNTNKPEIYGVIRMAGNVMLEITTEYGCKGEDSLMINAQPCCDMLFPDAFTPNGDGRNDLFRPITTGHHLLHAFIIKNRWGQTVFETTDDREGWNGQFNGVPQDMDVYFYYIKYDCNGNTMEQKGDVTLIR